MDSSDPEIVFDRDGVCNRCRDSSLLGAKTFSREFRGRSLDEIASWIGASRKGEFDCIVGVSGGLDSSYVLARAVELGLRPLALHVDNGWNTVTSTLNLSRLLEALKVPLVTKVLDWESFADLQLAFLRAGVPDCEIPTDHAVRASLFQEAHRHGLTSIITGVNSATEGFAVPSWSRGHSDWRYIASVHRRFGARSLRRYPRLDLAAQLRYRVLGRIREYALLELMDYSRESAEAYLAARLSWRPYQEKHGESSFTQFYQSVWLPDRFGFDKRKMHYSSLILRGQLTREAALDLLAEPAIAVDEADRLRRFVCKKLRITHAEYHAMLHGERRTIRDFDSYEDSPLARVGRWILRRAIDA